MSNKNILFLSPNPTDATSYYRAMGPLSHLVRNFNVDGHDLGLYHTTKTSWATVAPADVVFMQRPFTADHLKMARIAKANFKPIWLDFDDNLFDVPRDNPAFKIYSKPSVQQQVAEITAMADLVTVSTEALQDSLSALNPNIRVIQNAIDENFARVRPDKRGKRNGVVVWRGSPTHTKDLYSVTEQLFSMLKDQTFKDWRFHFQGFEPWWIAEVMGNRISSAEAVDLSEYMSFLHKLEPALMIVPLVDNPFNRSKSNIAYLEGCFAGAAIIAPNFPEFCRPGVINYRTAAEFEQVLRAAMTGKLDLEKIAEDGWNHILEHETLAVRNRLRQQALSDLFLMEFKTRKEKLPNWMSHKKF